MKTMILYYSYGGTTKKLAQHLALKKSAGLYEVKAQKTPGLLSAYTAGCFAALRGKRSPIEPIRANFADVDRLVVMGPVWAGKPAPAMNALLDQLPAGKQVEVRMVSASGKSKSREHVEAMVKARGCTLADFQDMKNK